MLPNDILLRLNSFLDEQDSKVAVYGLKLNAQAMYQIVPEHIACFLDRDVHSGNFCGLPILRLEDLPQYGIRTVVIAASLPAEPYIYERIHNFCGAHGIEIYGLNSGRLKCRRMGRSLSVEEHQEEALRQAIAEHDVISFDIFDTLLMRKVLYPADVFDLVEQRLRKVGIDVPGFRNYRVQAERGDRPYKDFDAIYSTLREMLGWTEEQMELAKREEMAAEWQVILPRPGMSEMMSYAHETGKKVLLISDMYLPSKFLEELLNEHGLENYDELFVSANRGTGKGEQLFELVRDAHPAVSYLHIGDNSILDGGCARMRGFDTWIIKSGMEMLRDTGISNILPLVENFNDRLLVGLFTSKAFGNPLAGRDGWFRIKDVPQFASLFMSPMAAQYVLWLVQRAMVKHFEAILFAARDGWLFCKLYQEAIAAMGLKDCPPGIYFYGSRKLCISAALQDEPSLYWMREILGEHTHYFLREVFGFVPEDTHEPPLKGENPDLIWDEVLRQKKDIFARSRSIRRGYEQYIASLGLQREGNYAFTDLCSQGSTLCALSHSLFTRLYGLIFARFLSASSVTMGRIETFLPQAENSHMLANNAAEFIFSSPEPSAASVDNDGKITFEQEDRSVKELKIFNKAQEAVREFCHDFFFLCDAEGNISPAVGQLMLSMYQNHSFAGASSVFEGHDIRDDLKGTRLDCLLDDEK